jgi:NTP pyrophosphatase (non-canonical NTP hydrolase)
MTLPIEEIQKQMSEWRHRNFSHTSIEGLFRKAMEELGELAEAGGKRLDGIGRSPQMWEAKEKDAIGDITLVLLAYCEARGFSFMECLEAAWDEVGKRDFRRYPRNGRNDLLQEFDCVVLLEDAPTWLAKNRKVIAAGSTGVIVHVHEGTSSLDPAYVVEIFEDDETVDVITVKASAVEREAP